jgi:hypothetical protein
MEAVSARLDTAPIESKVAIDTRYRRWHNFTTAFTSVFFVASGFYFEALV